MAGRKSVKKSTASSISRVDAAAAMYGKGSAQHKAAMKKFGKGGGPKSQIVSGQPRDSHGRWD